MSNIFNLISSIEGGPAAQPTAPARQTQIPSVPKPAQRPLGGANGASQAQPLKRKAEGEPDGVQAKIQRKDAAIPGDRANGSVRLAPRSDVAKPKPSTPANPIPYRGTASTGGLPAAKALSTIAKKPVSTANTPVGQLKPAASVPRPSPGAAPVPGAAPAPPKKGSYAAMMAKAKVVQQVRPAAPPVKHEPTKILTKKERMALHAEQKAAAKGKKIGSSGPSRAVDAKSGDADKEKRKPAEVRYQGTARPTKKPADIGYKGTARPSASSAGPTGKSTSLYDRSRSTSLSAKAKPKQDRGRYGGYGRWSDEEMEDEEEEDYESDASSDMEGGLWDMNEEEELSLKTAKKEDAEALREENEHKRAKEERKRKLMALSKSAAAKRKY